MYAFMYAGLTNMYACMKKYVMCIISVKIDIKPVVFSKNSSIVHPLSSNIPWWSAIRCFDLHLGQIVTTTPYQLIDYNF